MAVEKPASVAASPFKSAKWDEVTSGREFRPCDVPLLDMLCQWHEVVDKCMDNMDAGFTASQNGITLKRREGFAAPGRVTVSVEEHERLV